VKDREDADTLLTPSIPNAMVRQFLLMNLGVNKNQNYFWKINLNGIEKQLPNLRKFDPKGKIFEGKTIFISGSKSSYIKKEHHSTIQQFFPNSKIVTVDAGHWVHAEKPRDVIKLLTDLLTRS